MEKVLWKLPVNILNTIKRMCSERDEDKNIRCTLWRRYLEGVRSQKDMPCRVDVTLYSIPAQKEFTHDWPSVAYTV